MKTIPVLLLLAAACAPVTAVASPPVLHASSLARAAYDTNPIGSDGTSAAVLGSGGTFLFAAAAGADLALASDGPGRPALKLNYAGEATRFDHWPGEDFSTHRVGANGQFAAGPWKFTGEGSTLFIAGPRDTLLSVPTVNANAVAIWRERRRQWQHRLKLQTQTDAGAWLVRSTATLLAYDYRTRVVAGDVAFADRSDLQTALTLGWKATADSTWLAGVRAGRQRQEIVPLPNCEFDYSSDYARVSLGWEGRPFAGTTVALAAGPDFRRYTGAVDVRAFAGGRDRTSLWFEGNLVAKPRPSLTLSAKAARMAWLSSTGKAAYIDSSLEVAGAWVVTPLWAARISAKVHRCDFFPTPRDDWESFVGAGLTRKFSPRAALSADLLHHRAWNELVNVPERQFGRFVVQLGATWEL